MAVTPYSTRLRRRGSRFTALVGLLVTACADASGGANLGALCAAPPGPACVPDLVCLDRICRQRSPAEDPDPINLPPTAVFDVVVPDPPDLLGDLHEDTPPPPPDVRPPDRLLVGEFSDEDPSDARLSLAPGQAAARQVAIPNISNAELIRVHAQNTSAAAACGRFRAVLWAPRELLPEGDATFAIAPDFMGPEREVAAAPGERVIVDLPFSPTAPEVGRAPYRIGARYEGLCSDVTLSPWVIVDASGDTAGSFIWSDAWVLSGELGLPGRWGVQLGIVL